MASSYHTRIVTVTAGDDKLKELDEALAEEAKQGYELHSLTAITPARAPTFPPYLEELLVVTKKPKEKPKDS